MSFTWGSVPFSLGDIGCVLSPRRTSLPSPTAGQGFSSCWGHWQDLCPGIPTRNCRFGWWLLLCFHNVLAASTLLHLGGSVGCFSWFEGRSGSQGLDVLEERAAGPAWSTSGCAAPCLLPR